MRDKKKKEALFEATVRLVNEIGFVSSSVSKIAKEAGISPATIYIYHENKEDLLISTYVQIKIKLSQAILKNFDGTQPVRDILSTIWKNTFAFNRQHRDWFQYVEQFSNSPFSDLVNPEEIEKYYEPIMEVLRSGIERKILKDVPHEMLTAFVFYPAIVLSNQRLCAGLKLDDQNIESAFTMAWDAVKL